MVRVRRWMMVAGLVGMAVARMAAQCPPRPQSGTVVQDAYTITSQNGVLQAAFSLGESVDEQGFTHYCYQYQTPNGVVEAPTLRLNPGDQLDLSVADVIQDNDASKMKMHHAATGQVCGDGGTPTVSSTNVHFHGMPVQPVCHQDDVIDTLIQPGSPAFDFNIPIPKDTPPGLYWYHPHVHGFTEFQVNGGAAGAIVVNGMEKVRPEVKGLKERVFVLRQQYLVPWIPGPYDLTINYQISAFPHGASPVINMKPGEKQFWRVANATLQDFMPLQVQINGKPAPLELIALDGYPLRETRKTDTILVPPAGRAEFIVEGPPAGGTGVFLTGAYDTGPTGNADLSILIAMITPTGGGDAQAPAAKAGEAAPEKASAAAEKSANAEGAKSTSAAEAGSGNGASANAAAANAAAANAAAADTGPFETKRADDEAKPAIVQRKLYFSEEFGGTNGPIQFYVTVNGQQQKVFDPNEEPVIKTHLGAVEEWTIENHALETHAFHIHQIHFKVLEIDGKPGGDGDMLDTIAIPYWPGSGPYHSVKLKMYFTDPAIVGTFLFHCHILLHEDLGMMHKIEVDP